MALTYWSNTSVNLDKLQVNLLVPHTIECHFFLTVMTVESGVVTHYLDM